MAETITIDGVALAFVERSFNSFTDRQTGEVVAAGVTRTLWLGTEFAEEPTQVKVSESEVPLLATCVRGSAVRAECTVFANGNRIAYKLRACTIVAPGKAAAA